MGFHFNLAPVLAIISHATHGLAAIKAEVEGLAGAAMRGTDNAATEAKQDTIDGIVDDIKAVTANLPDSGALNDLASILSDTDSTLPAQITALVDDYLNNGTHGLPALETLVDDIETLVATTVMGRAQEKATTISLNQGASTYDLFEGTGQIVRLEGLSIKMPSAQAAGSLTSISIQTDDATPGVIISSTDGAVANLTSEADISWVGNLYITSGTKIQLTIAGGAHGSAYTCNVIAKYRAVVSGGYLA